MRAAELAFHAAHAKRYGHDADAPAEVVTVRIAASARTAKPALRSPAHVGANSGHQTRPILLDGEWCDTAVLTRPALVEEMGSVTVVPPGWRPEVGAIGELHLRCERRDRSNTSDWRGRTDPTHNRPSGEYPTGGRGEANSRADALGDGCGGDHSA